MGFRLCRGALLASLFAAVTGALGQTPIQQLRQLYPEARTFESGGRVRIIYGAAMTPGMNAEDAASRWIEEHGATFGVGTLDLRHIWTARPRSDDRVVILAFKQFVRNRPVDGGTVRMMVRRDPIPRVVYVSATLASDPGLGPEQLPVPSQIAQTLALAQPGYSGLVLSGAPELVLLPGSSDRTDAWAWRIRTTPAEPFLPHAWTFYLSALDGRRLHVRDEALPYDITGTVFAKATPSNALPDTSGNPPATTILGSVRVFPSTGGTLVTTAGGGYSLTMSGSGQQVGFVSALGPSSGLGGPYVCVADVSEINCPAFCGNQSAEFAMEGNTTATNPATQNLLFPNVSSPSEFDVAQVNAFVEIMRYRAYILSGNAPEEQFQTQIKVKVNAACTFFPTTYACNAFYFPCDGTPIISCGASTSGCWNTAYSSILAHEFGHHVLDMLGLTVSSA